MILPPWAKTKTRPALSWLTWEPASSSLFQWSLVTQKWHHSSSSQQKLRAMLQPCCWTGYCCVCGCAFEKMATPEKAVTLIHAPAYGVVWNDLQGLLTVVLDCRWFEARFKVPLKTLWGTRVVYVLRVKFKHFLAVCLTLSSRKPAGLKSISLLLQLACCFVLASSGCAAGHE